jgi:hypothetical protein
MTAVEIRRATAGDCEAVAEMCALLWPELNTDGMNFSPSSY